MKTILYLHSSSDLYGSDRSLMRTIQGLDPSRVRAIVCLPYHGPLVERLRDSGATVYVTSLAVMRRKNFTPPGIVQFALSFVSAIVRVHRIIRRHHVDLLHSNTSAVLVGGIVARWSGLPHFWHVREILISPVLVRKLIARSVTRGATLVLGVSKSVIENLAIDEPRVRVKSRVLHNGIRTSDFVDGRGEHFRREAGASATDVLVGMLGRVGSWKGQELLLEAATCVRNAGATGVRFVAVGSPFLGNEGSRSQLVDLISRRNMSDIFLVMDFRPDVSNVLAGLDIFVLPSVLPDPFPTTVLEAMAAAKPIVANAHGGVVEMIENGKSGYLVPPNNAVTMAERLLTLVKDLDLRVRMGLAAQSRARELFDFEIYRREMNALYDAYLKERPE